ncbi:MAG TPA: hypothetical protein VEW05_23395 [Candidatus Polarisedimenticolia bacterium]|nr:hypothetical protein [Candidatus Polarisedimenticolia bacterium]
MVSRLRFLGVRAAGISIALFETFCNLDGACSFRGLWLGPFGAGSLSVAGGNPGAAFHDFTVRWSVFAVAFGLLAAGGLPNYFTDQRAAYPSTDVIHMKWDRPLSCASSASALRTWKIK